jgi:hypothetical protein
MQRLDDALAARRLELGADVPDVAVDRAVGDLAVGGIHARNQAVAVAHVLGPAQELLEERELGGREGNRLPRISGRVLRGIEVQQPVLQRSIRRCRRPWLLQPLQDHLDAGHQFARAEGLGHIVVAADLQAQDAVHLRIVRGQEQDRHVGRLADLPAHAEAVQFGEAHVEDNEIGVAFAEGADGRLAVARLQGCEAGLVQRKPHNLPDVRIIINDQDRGCHALLPEASAAGLVGAAQGRFTAKQGQVFVAAPLEP